MRANNDCPFADFQASTKTSRYVLAERISTDAMGGSVHVGYRRGAEGFRRPVAIKRATIDLLQSPELRSELLHAAHLASRVRHPNVVGVDDVEEVDGELWLVMEHVEGTTLRQLLDQVRIPVGIALRIALDVAAGLAAVHGANDFDGAPLGLVHRDVAPENILVGSDGVARLTDFGIAKRISEPRATATTMRKGRLAYMSPEYLADGTFTPRSDMFVFGTVLWELLSGRRLFLARTESESMRKVLAANVPPLEDAPRWLASVATKSLARDPSARFQDMTEVVEALDMARPLADAPRSAVAALVGQAMRERALRAAAKPSSEPVSVGLQPRPARLVTLPAPPEVARPGAASRTRAVAVALAFGAFCTLAALALLGH